MTHSALLGDVEVPVTYSKEEAVGLMQEAGLVGAGGAGFPTHVKYAQPPRTLIVNCAESEPGYYADKLLLRDEPEALVDVFDWLNDTFSIDTVILGAEDVARPYMQDFEAIAERLQNFSIGYFDAKYKYGQERALCKVLMGMEIPSSDLPSDHGILVNNNETMFNIYRAVFRDRPLITKFVHLYGEVEPLGVYEVPIGTLAADLIRLHGKDPSEFASCKLYDGGPILADLVLEEMGDEPMAPVGKTTNAFLVVDPEKDRPRNKYYPHPDYAKYHNSIDAPWAPDRIVNVENEIDRVRVPRAAAFGKKAAICVEVGDEVEARDTIGNPQLGLSVGLHASISGTVTEITDDHVEIVQRR